MSASEDPDTQTPPRDETELCSRPTHRLQEIKVGDNSVQLLVSTKDHLYDAKDVGAGVNSYQVIGSWEDSSVQELTKILNQRQAITNRQSPAYAEASRFEKHGAGKSLAEAGREQHNRAVDRPQRSE
ncbi:hypothetical protein FOXG_17388 [Fusarium oxysporum f. sp. lycopersici 4287]|jgi:hypothetical protein|uniref:Uncharacterized protein n=7 Tax=Fusarium oxysporum TaxID=5507 RepID=A0A2H3GL10_FUSOX|nr:uncharacterized protein FOXG_17388 [Fusarium oxysporum f. sp. lycopersici 4287]EXA36941.1 hypothetical protein FOVG_11252 [Fusarium oxysporum f. sp. pisi HDV247]EXK34504.1 hypothetical protein FOMG_09896 [Fusarium oxysporum f. sp. melonis 26406]EXM18737.1 hypothetical protein FOTG_13263 [Fusarium oxysporum f. sp. vasinfectum 25433]KAJ4117017.1 hypothetical protein NW765_010430 [Fusarium oxysporum]KAK2671486.1 hypothetical protein RAB80_013908 [Fusarium oxysporum f. sp. vasinfectum]PCD28628